MRKRVTAREQEKRTLRGELDRLKARLDEVEFLESMQSAAAGAIADLHSGQPVKTTISVHNIKSGRVTYVILPRGNETMLATWLGTYLRKLRRRRVRGVLKGSR